MVATAALLTYVAMLAPLERWIGASFVALLALYVRYAWRQERAGAPGGHTAAFDRAEAYEGAHDAAAAPLHGAKAGSILAPVLIALGGLALVVLGGNLLVTGAIGMARAFGISETVIGLTIVAVGTSMPEFVTSVIAALRRQADVALGNVLGSNIYNILGIGGLTALIAPVTVPPEIVRFDNHVMLGVSILLLVFAATGLRIGRREGCVMLAGYAAYVWVIWPK
jgi:cation:H+ antiporter